MKETITKVLMIGLILLFLAGILSLSAAIFIAGLIAASVFAAYISIRRWWLRKKGMPVSETLWTQSFRKDFSPSPSQERENRENESITIIEVEYEEVKEKDKP